MKKLISLMFVALVVLASCSGANLKSIDEKIKNEGIEATFSSGEYDAMIGFLEKLVDKNPKYDAEDGTQLDQFSDDFGKMFSYMMVLGMAEGDGKLSSSQTKKLARIKEKSQNAYINQEIDNAY